MARCIHDNRYIKLGFTSIEEKVQGSSSTPCILSGCSLYCKLYTLFYLYLSPCGGILDQFAVDKIIPLSNNTIVWGIQEMSDIQQHCPYKGQWLLSTTDGWIHRCCSSAILQVQFLCSREDSTSITMAAASYEVTEVNDLGNYILNIKIKNLRYVKGLLICWSRSISATQICCNSVTDTPSHDCSKQHNDRSCSRRMVFKSYLYSIFTDELPVHSAASCSCEVIRASVWQRAV